MRRNQSRLNHPRRRPRLPGVDRHGSDGPEEVMSRLLDLEFAPYGPPPSMIESEEDEEEEDDYDTSRHVWEAAPSEVVQPVRRPLGSEEGEPAVAEPGLAAASAQGQAPDEVSEGGVARYLSPQPVAADWGDNDWEASRDTARARYGDVGTGADRGTAAQAAPAESAAFGSSGDGFDVEAALAEQLGAPADVYGHVTEPSRTAPPDSSPTPAVEGEANLAGVDQAAPASAAEETEEEAWTPPAYVPEETFFAKKAGRRRSG